MYDRFGRTLAYLDKADGWDYSVEAARAGAAHSYIYHRHPSARADEIAAAEQEAKAAGRGLTEYAFREVLAGPYRGTQ